jgi:hypothetical protein
MSAARRSAPILVAAWGIACASAPAGPAGALWHGAFPAAAASATGTFTVYPASTMYETRFVLEVRNLPPQSAVRWRMYEGECANQGGVVGPQAEIRDVAADAGGAARADVRLGMRPPAGGKEAARYSAVVLVTPPGGRAQRLCANLRAVTNVLAGR